jgi:hypothetical protein
MKSFERWTIDEVEEHFGLQQTFTSTKLDAWLASNYPIPAEEHIVLEKLRNTAFLNIEYWNEEDLKIKFLAFILDIVQFDETRYKGFLERTIKVPYNGEIFGGIVDYVVATGKAEPRVPFFFIQEYKPQRRSGRDPLAQVLSAMVAARELNKPHKTMYGSYVIGRQWFFVVLDERTYTISAAYDITQEDILHVVMILRGMKQIIDDWLDAAL